MFFKEFRKKNIYTSRIWLDKFEHKETKKRQYGIKSSTGTDLFAPSAQYSPNRWVIFTAQNVRRDKEETHKIQSIHAELEEIPLSRSYALAYS